MLEKIVNTQDISKFTGARLAALILREAEKVGRRLTFFELCGLLYLVYGWGLVNFDIALTGREKLRAYEYGPYFDSLDMLGSYTGFKQVNFGQISGVSELDPAIYDDDPRFVELVRQILEIEAPPQQLWNGTHSRQDGPWSRARAGLNPNSGFTPDIESRDVRDSFLHLANHRLGATRSESN